MNHEATKAQSEMPAPDGLCSFDRWMAWRRQHYQHDEAGNFVRCQVCGRFIPKQPVEQLAQVQAINRPCSHKTTVQVKVGNGAGKAAFHQKLRQAFELFLGFFGIHIRKAKQG